MTTPAPSARPDPRAALPRLDRHVPRCGPVRRSRASRWRAAVLIGVQVLIGVHIAQWLLTGSTLTPVEPSEAGYLLDAGRLNAGFVLFVLLIASTLVFGRWFCGWGCHVVALQDLCAWLLGRVRLRPRPVRSRLLVLAPFVVAFHMFFQSQLERWWAGAPNPRIEPAFTTTELWERFPGPLMGVLTFLVVGFLIVWWLGAKGFCTFGCPYGAFFALADRFAPGRIRVTDACDACGHCTSVCTSNVRVHEEVARHRKVVDPACMKCLDCVSVCPKDALYFGFTTPSLWTRSQQRIAARADFTWPEEVALAALAWSATVGFRGAWFGEGIPFLMAVGLGVITAVFAVLGARLLRRRELQFQHTPLRAGGRLTRAGRLAAAATLLWTLFAAHTAAINWWANGAPFGLSAGVVDDAVALLRQQRRSRDVAPQQFAAVEARLAALDALSLWTAPTVLGMHGLVLRELGRNEDAIAQLERMVARRGLDTPRARVLAADDALANYYLLLGRTAAARRLAEGVLAVDPDDATARALLRGLPR